MNYAIYFNGVELAMRSYYYMQCDTEQLYKGLFTWYDSDCDLFVAARELYGI